MKKTIRRGLGVLMLAGILLTVSACGSDSKSAAEQSSVSSAPGEMMWDAAGSAAPETPSYEADNTAKAKDEDSGTGSTIYRGSDVKLIRKAEMEVQTTQFDETGKALEKLVTDCQGYFEQSNVYGGGYRDSNALRWGCYVVRVPAEQYESFLNHAGDLGYVVSKNQSTQDVGEQYYDTESRLRAQETKRDRLMDLLAKADTMESIVALEDALSETEYQIESLSSTLKQYDSLVGYSTITINLNEVKKVEEEPGTTASLLNRMGAGLSASLENFVEGVQELLVWTAYHAIGLLIFAGAVIVLIIVIRIRVKKVLDRHKAGVQKEIEKTE